MLSPRKSAAVILSVAYPVVRSNSTEPTGCVVALIFVPLRLAPLCSCAYCMDLGVLPSSTTTVAPTNASMCARDSMMRTRHDSPRTAVASMPSVSASHQSYGIGFMVMTAGAYFFPARRCWAIRSCHAHCATALTFLIAVTKRRRSMSPATARGSGLHGSSAPPTPTTKSNAQKPCAPRAHLAPIDSCGATVRTASISDDCGTSTGKRPSRAGRRNL
mmetsp:Transcript_63449/g.174186  ORF Transcript_63449/g.174186 Transcript_63449/m.174186 type:complete len:217 (-) Transcript_63449:325-975(-)